LTKEKRVHSKARLIVLKGSIGAVSFVSWAVAKQFAAVSDSPSRVSITTPRYDQETGSCACSRMAYLRVISASLGEPSCKCVIPRAWRLGMWLGLMERLSS